MTSQSNSPSSKPKPSKRWVILGGCAVFIGGAVIIVGLLAFLLWGGGGEPATLSVPIRVDSEFLQAIHDQDIDLVYGLISENFKPPISKDQLVPLIQQDQKIWDNYQRFDVCEWGFFLSDGRVITSSGLLYYTGGAIVAEISLHKDSDSVWRVQGFRFRPDISPKPYGLCQ